MKWEIYLWNCGSTISWDRVSEAVEPFNHILKYV